MVLQNAAPGCAQGLPRNEDCVVPPYEPRLDVMRSSALASGHNSVCSLHGGSRVRFLHLVSDGCRCRRQSKAALALPRTPSDLVGLNGIGFCPNALKHTALRLAAAIRGATCLQRCMVARRALLCYCPMLTFAPGDDAKTSLMHRRRSTLVATSPSR